MRNIVAALSVALVTGCSWHKPVLVSMLTPVPRDTVNACALQQITTLGYTVEHTDLLMGGVYARKLTHEFDKGKLGGNRRYDVLKERVVEDDTTPRTMQVVAASEREEWNLTGHTHLKASRPSDQVKADAKKVISVCSPGAK